MNKEDLQHINELIVRVALLDEQALNELYDTIGARMMSVAFGVLKDRHLAEDTLQESFLKIVKNAGQFRVWQNGYGWACTIARNTALNILKQQKTRGEVSIEDFYSLSDKSDEYSKTDLTVTVESALLQLSEKQREVIRFKYYDELSVREIAKIASMSKSAVQRMIDSAEKILKRYFT